MSVTLNGPNSSVSETESGQYCSHLTFDPSLTLVIMTMEGQCSCDTIRQKSITVLASGPGVCENIQGMCRNIQGVCGNTQGMCRNIQGVCGNMQGMCRDIQGVCRGIYKGM